MNQVSSIILLLFALALGGVKAALADKHDRIWTFILWFLAPFLVLGFFTETCSSIKERNDPEYWDYHEREYNP